MVRDAVTGLSSRLKTRTTINFLEKAGQAQGASLQLRFSICKTSCCPGTEWFLPSVLQEVPQEPGQALELQSLEGSAEGPV